jgi:hypothetical protein
MKTKILSILFFAAVAVSVYLTYDRVIVRQDFETFDSSLETE